MTVPPSGAPDGAPHGSAPAGPGPSAPEGWPPAGWPARRARSSAAVPAATSTGQAPGSIAPAAWPGAEPAAGVPAGWPTRGSGGAGPAARGGPTWSPGRFHWGDLLAVVSYVALMIVGLGLLLAVALRLVPEDLSTFSVLDGFTVNLLSYAILVVIVLAVAWRPLVTSLRVFRTGTWWKILLLPATWLACIVINVVLLSLLGQPQTSANQAALEEMTTQAPPALMILMTVVAAPLVEEYLFRHLLVGKLSRYVNVWVCAVVSVLAFTLLHFVSTGFHFDLIQTVPYLTLAVAITVSYILLDLSFGYAVLLHMVNNGIAIAMLYLVAPLLRDMPQPVPTSMFLPALTALLG